MKLIRLSLVERETQRTNEELEIVPFLGMILESTGRWPKILSGNLLVV
jgi:hypothetical protein